jgi:hypothetical protein
MVEVKEMKVEKDEIWMIELKIEMEKEIESCKR